MPGHSPAQSGRWTRLRHRRPMSSSPTQRSSLFQALNWRMRCEKNVRPAKVLLFSSNADANGLLQGPLAAGDGFALLPGPLGLLNLMEGIHSLIHDAPPPYSFPTINRDVKPS